MSIVFNIEARQYDIKINLAISSSPIFFFFASPLQLEPGNIYTTQKPTFLYSAYKIYILSIITGNARPIMRKKVSNYIFTIQPAIIERSKRANNIEHRAVKSRDYEGIKSPQRDDIIHLATATESGPVTK